jgi:hypothetical protein
VSTTLGTAHQATEKATVSTTLGTTEKATAKETESATLELVDLLGRGSGGSGDESRESEGVGNHFEVCVVEVVVCCVVEVFREC